MERGPLRSARRVLTACIAMLLATMMLPLASGAVSVKTPTEPKISNLPAVASAERGSTATNAALTWGQPLLADPEHGDPTSVSCPTATFCAVVDSMGSVLTYNGTSWSRPKSVDPGRFSSISCPTKTFCAAVGSGHTGSGGTAVTYNGTSWSSQQSVDVNSSPGINSVSCPTTTFCVAVDSSGNALTYNGTSWSSPKIVDKSRIFNSVSCPTTTFCVAVESGWGDIALTYNGTSWSQPKSVNADGGNLNFVSCPTKTFCAAVDSSGNALTYNGTSWSHPKDVDPGGSQLSSVSCPTATSCVAVDSSGEDLTYNGTSWSSPASINGYRDICSVSCPTTALCMAINSYGIALTYNGTSWGSPESVDADAGRLKLVSCPTTTFCVAVDAYGDALTYNGTSWSGPSSIDPNGGMLESRLVPDDDLLRGCRLKRRCPHLRRDLVERPIEHRSQRWHLRGCLVPDDDLLRGCRSERQRPHLQRDLVEPTEERRSGSRRLECCLVPDDDLLRGRRSGAALTYNGTSWPGCLLRHHRLPRQPPGRLVGRDCLDGPAERADGTGPLGVDLRGCRAQGRARASHPAALEGLYRASDRADRPVPELALRGHGERPLPGGRGVDDLDDLGHGARAARRGHGHRGAHRVPPGALADESRLAGCGDCGLCRADPGRSSVSRCAGSPTPSEARTPSTRARGLPAASGVELAFTYYGGYRRYRDWDAFDVRRIPVEPYVTGSYFRSVVRWPTLMAPPLGRGLAGCVADTLRGWVGS